MCLLRLPYELFSYIDYIYHGLYQIEVMFTMEIVIPRRDYIVLNVLLVQAGKLIANLIVIGSTYLARGLIEGYRKALASKFHTISVLHCVLGCFFCLFSFVSLDEVCFSHFVFLSRIISLLLFVKFVYLTDFFLCS